MKKLFTSVSAGVITTLVPLVASAQLQGDTVFRRQGQEIPKGGTANLSTISAIGEKVANWIFTALLIFAVIWIIIAAFKYLFSGGDDTKIKEAHRALLYAAVAIAVGLLSQAIVFIVAQITLRGGGPGV